MQVLHCKLDVVLVQILPYNCSETDYSFCKDSPPSRTPPSTQMWVSPSDPFSPHYFFSLRRPWSRIEGAGRPAMVPSPSSEIWRQCSPIQGGGARAAAGSIPSIERAVGYDFNSVVRLKPKCISETF